MDPISMGLIAGGASLLGNIFSSTTSASAQEQINQQNIAATQQNIQQQEAFQTQMSNTAYQRAGADMTKAGLNPMMMFGSGGAASTPSGAGGVANLQPVNKAAGAASLGEAVKSGVSAMVSAKQSDMMTQEIANLKTQQEKLVAETKTEAMRPPQIASGIGLTEAETRARLKEMPVSELRGVSAQDILNLSPTARSILNNAGFIGGKVSDAISPITNSAGTVSRLLSDQLSRKVSRGNFIDRYGIPVDEYLSH